HLPSPVDTCGPSRITKTTCDWYQTATEISVGFSLMTSTPVSTGCWLTERVLALSFMVSAPTLWAWVDASSPSRYLGRCRPCWKPFVQAEGSWSVPPGLP